ncbi:Iguana/Dzip1-like DAZ-interacting protein N-terminal-domain-containing protein [Obelidium mucronatum]|nr:Iguana/Dzip1-like DAZ-interacting protein N-terminal-domain-containing protein [Obelidium mucronatum]
MAARLQRDAHPAPHGESGIRTRLHNITNEANHALAGFRLRSKNKQTEDGEPPQLHHHQEQMHSRPGSSTNPPAEFIYSQTPQRVSPASNVGGSLRGSDENLDSSNRFIKEAAPVYTNLKSDPTPQPQFGFGKQPHTANKCHTVPQSQIGTMAGFYFKRRSERLDWRLLASLQVDRVQREVDIPALQEIMENITFCDVDAEDVRYVDPNFLKLFKISQLIIEYLVHTQDFLSETQSVLSHDLQATLDKLDTITVLHEKQTAEFNAAKKENRNLKKTLYAYQLMARVPGYSADSGGNGNEAATYHRCTQCSKVFKANVYLENHILRRHPEMARNLPPQDHDMPRYAGGHPAYTQQQPTMFPGGFYSMMGPGSNQPTTLESLNQTVASLSTKMKETEQKLREEMEERLSKELKEKQKSLQEKYEQERLKNEKDIQSLKAEIHQQLSDERATFEEEKIALETIVKQVQARNKKSRFGVLEDDEDGRLLGPTQAADLEKKHAAAISEITTKFEEQMNNMKKSLAFDREREKEELQFSLTKAQNQITWLQSLVNQEHALNVQRDEEAKRWFGTRRSNKKKTKDSSDEDDGGSSHMSALAAGAAGLAVAGIAGGIAARVASHSRASSNNPRNISDIPASGPEERSRGLMSSAMGLMSQSDPPARDLGSAAVGLIMGKPSGPGSNIANATMGVLAHSGGDVTKQLASGVMGMMGNQGNDTAKNVTSTAIGMLANSGSAPPNNLAGAASAVLGTMMSPGAASSAAIASASRKLPQ